MRVLEIPNRAAVNFVTYGRTGRQLIAAAGNRYFVWDLESFELQREVPRSWASVSALEYLFLTSGRAFLEANGYWSPEDELPVTQQLNPEHTQHFSGSPRRSGVLCFSADGRNFFREAYGQLWRSPERLGLWDFAGKCLRAYPLVGLAGPRCAAFSPDGAILAYGTLGAIVVLVDADTSEPITELSHTDRLYGLTFSPDGRSLATSAGRLVRVWRVTDGKCIHRFRAFRAHSECHAFSPDGKLLLAGSREGRARLWEVESGRELADHDWGQGDIHDVAFSPDGLTAAAACKKAVVVWDIDV